MILRIFLQKTKKILILLQNLGNEEDIEKVIAEHKPAIFWKDKPIIKKQMQLWSLKSINNLISKLNEIELTVKKNNSLSLILMKNFIFEVMENN